MASKSTKGSIIAQILIVIFAAALYIVLTVPPSIWEQEKVESTTSHLNMSSIYEGEKFYHRLTHRYTTDKDELLSRIKADSSLINEQKLVDYTQQLKDQIDAYLNNPFVSSLLKLSQNIANIKSDLENNARYFKVHEDIANEAAELKQQVSSFNSDIKFPNYSHDASLLDTLYQLRRDLSDLNLQTAAAHSKELIENINQYLKDVEVAKIREQWAVLSTRIKAFNKAVKATDLVKRTSVADRIKDFNQYAVSALDKLNTLNLDQQLKEDDAIKEKIENLYQTFLKDFIITNKISRYKLSEQDMLVYNLSKDNFFSPVNHQPYVIIIDADSSDVKVESPMLFDELKEMVTPIAGEVSTFDYLHSFGSYLDTLKMIHEKGLAIKKKIRRNIEILVSNKELESLIQKYENSSEYSSYKDLMDFVEMVNNSKSFSSIVEDAGKARSALSIFEQMYDQSLFNNLDSLNTDVINNLNHYNDVLSKVRRLPRGVKNFDAEITKLNAVLEKIKQAKPNIEQLKTLQDKLADVLRFAADGKEITVDMVFKKTLKNAGYIHRNTKSWEEKKNK